MQNIFPEVALIHRTSKSSEIFRAEKRIDEQPKREAKVKW